MPKVVDHDEERHKLVVGAIKYITDYGLFGFTLRGLAAQQNVTKGCLQHYYDSKEALILDTIDHLESLFIEMTESDIDENFDLACVGLHLMLPTNKRRRGLWRVRLELGLLASQSDIVSDAISEWHHREFLTGVKLLKKAKAGSGRFKSDFKPSTAYRSLLAIVYGCAVTVNINPKHLTASVQNEIIAKAISDLSE